MVLNVRNVLGWLLAEAMIITGVVRRRAQKLLEEECVVSIYFHKPSKKEFEYCIKWLKKNGFQFLSVADVGRIIQGNLPWPKGSVVVTVDDGWRSNEKNVVEVASFYEVPVTIFVATAPVEEGAFWWSYASEAQKKKVTSLSVEQMKKLPNDKRLSKLGEIKKQVSLQREAMTVTQVKRIANHPLITIGSHTHIHPILIHCKENEVYDELKISKEKLEAWTGKEVSYFAYPNGDYTQREIEMLQKLNYQLAFSLKPEYLVKNTLTSKYELPRFGFLEGASLAENICRITGIWKPLMQKVNVFRKR